MPPKAHAWKHPVEDLERFRGLKHHQESKIEVSHQVGRWIGLAFRATNDIDKKIDCSLHHQNTAGKASMKKIQSKAKKSRSRKKRPAAVIEEENDDDRHGQLLLSMNLLEIVDDFPTSLEMSVASRKRQLAMEA